MITHFILERACTLQPEERQKTMNLLALIKDLQKISITEVSNVVRETFNIDRARLDQLSEDLEAKDKIKRLDENFVKLP